MLNAPQTRDVIRDFKHEPECVAAVLLKCIGGLAIVTCIAVIGASADLTPERAQAQPPAVKSQVSSRALKD